MNCSDYRPVHIGYVLLSLIYRVCGQLTLTQLTAGSLIVSALCIFNNYFHLH